MTRPRASTVLRRFLDGASIGDLMTWLGEYQLGQPTLTYVEHCIRRGLRGEVKMPTARRRPRSKS